LDEGVGNATVDESYGLIEVIGMDYLRSVYGDGGGAHSILDPSFTVTLSVLHPDTEIAIRIDRVETE
jgi:hypothetical protein